MTLSAIQLLYILGGGFIAVTNIGILSVLGLKGFKKSLKEAAYKGTKEVLREELK